MHNRKHINFLAIVFVLGGFFIYPSTGRAENQDQDPIDMINEIINKEPNNAHNYVQRALIYQLQREHKLAIADFDKAISINPNYMEAYHNRGALYSALHETDKALNDFDKAISIKPSDLTYSARGILYIGMGELDKAIEDFTKAIDLNPSKPTAYFYRATAYSDQKEYDKSWRDVQTLEALGVEVDPSFLDELEKASPRKA